MFRSLHMKLVLIMLLLITSLMAVVGAFLMTSVTNFYIDNFYSQMGETFGESNADFVNSLRAEAAQEGGVAVMQSMLETYSGTLGIDSRSRNYYILDAASGECLAASDELGGEKLEQTANLLTARNGQVGDESDIAAGYMDVAIPISGGDNSYIIYIRDNRSTVSSLNSELLIIILQALLVGLLISVLLSFLLSKTMINPIEKLTEGAERVASGDFSEKLEVDSTDEIGILTTTFNDMASVLHSTLEAVEDERNKLDTLFLHMTDGVVAYDRDGALIHCNPAASELLERSADECVYADLFEPLCPFEKVMAMQRSDFVASELTVGARSSCTSRPFPMKSAAACSSCSMTSRSSARPRSAAASSWRTSPTSCAPRSRISAPTPRPSATRATSCRASWKTASSTSSSTSPTA